MLYRLINNINKIMNYELALKLKEAGFPQEFKKGDFYYNEWIREWKPEKILQCLGGIEQHIKDYKNYNECGNCECDWCFEVLGRMGVDGIIKIPTLSELIEACGNKFFSLVMIKKNEFRVFYTKCDMKKIYFKGSTPEEAVANLWLELNKDNMFQPKTKEQLEDCSDLDTNEI